MNTLSKDIRDQFDLLWKRIDWFTIEPGREGDIRTFRKWCEFFSFYVCRHAEYAETYMFSIEDSMGSQVFSRSFEIKGDGEAADLEAKKIADTYIQEFMKAAVLAWMGFELTPTRPADEIRMIQISADDGGLIGVGEDGNVYIFLKSGWFPLPMKKLTEEDAEKDLAAAGLRGVILKK